MVHLTWLSGFHFVIPTANGWSEDRCWLIITQAFAEGHVASVHGAAGRLADAVFAERCNGESSCFLFNKMGQWNNKKWWIRLNNYIYIITILNYQSTIGVPWCTQFWPIACDVEVSYVGYPKSSRLWGIYALFIVIQWGAKKLLRFKSLPTTWHKVLKHQTCGRMWKVFVMVI